MKKNQFRPVKPMKPIKPMKPGNTGKKEKSRIWWYLQWVFGLIFVVASLEFFKDGYIPGGMMCLLLGMALCPTIWDILRERGVRVHMAVRIAITAFLFLTAAFSVPLHNVREESLRKEAEELGVDIEDLRDKEEQSLPGAGGGEEP